MRSSTPTYVHTFRPGSIKGLRPQQLSYWRVRWPPRTTTTTTTQGWGGGGEGKEKKGLPKYWHQSQTFLFRPSPSDPARLSGSSSVSDPNRLPSLSPPLSLSSAAGEAKGEGLHPTLGCSGHCGSGMPPLSSSQRSTRPPEERSGAKCVCAHIREYPRITHVYVNVYAYICMRLCTYSEKRRHTRGRKVLPVPPLPFHASEIGR